MIELIDVACLSLSVWVGVMWLTDLMLTGVEPRMRGGGEGVVGGV